MEIALIGMPKSGKTTLLDALTRGRFEAQSAGSGRQQLQAGVVKVPDPRLDSLAFLFNPEKVVPAEVTCWDIPASLEATSNGNGISGQTVNLLQKADALLHVIRAFEDPAVPYHQTTINPYRDADAMEAELIFCDLAILERRRQRLDANMKGARASERSTILREGELLTRLQESLENEVRVREMELAADEQGIVTSYNLLTGKPVLAVFNVDEDALGSEQRAEGDRHRPGLLTTSVCAKLEQELTQLSPDDEQEFRQSLGLRESGLDRVVRLSYQLLGMVSFFTVGPDEVRAWTVPDGMPALKAASKIHSDIERGFIRAEVISYPLLVDSGSIAQAKKQGLVRLEGKTYPVQDGDVITFLFNV